MKHVHVPATGSAEVLQIIESPLPELKEDHVMMQVHYCGINRAEVLQRAGKVPVTPGFTAILGLEAVGYILDSEGKVLYPAMGILPGGSYSQYTPINKNHVIKVPTNLSLEQCAAIPEAWITAYQLLRYIGGVEAGQSVLIYAAASGVGTAAIQLAKLFGARVIASSSSSEKLAICSELGASLCINYKELSHAQQSEKIRAFTGGKGVDIVLDCVAASNQSLTEDVLGMDSKWIIYGAMGGPVFDKFNVGAIMRKRASIITTLLKSRSDAYKADLTAKFTADVMPAFANGTLKPIVDRVIPFAWDDTENGVAKWREAHLAMESNATVGKIIMKFPSIE